MDIAYISVTAPIDIRLPEDACRELEGSVGDGVLDVCASIQYVHALDAIEKQLQCNVRRLRGAHCKIPGQVLGCDAFSEADAVLYIGDGMFHPKGIAAEKVYAYHPDRGELVQVRGQRQKAARSAFLMADAIGVLVSVKPGQNRMEESMALKMKYPDKRFFFVCCDTLDPAQLENFPFVQMWINTMCPRIAVDDRGKFPKPILNLVDIDG